MAVQHVPSTKIHIKRSKWMHYSTLSITATSVASQPGTIYARVNPGQQGDLEVRCQQRHLHTYLSNNNLWRGRHVNRSDPDGCGLSWLRRREESQRSRFTADRGNDGDGGGVEVLKNPYNESMHWSDE